MCPKVLYRMLYCESGICLVVLNPPYYSGSLTNSRKADIVVTGSQQTSFLGMPAIVTSPVMRKLLELVERIAQSNAAVLITGESGSGKELIARAVHHYSLRNAKPWVDVSCAALPENLVESELFGYEKGAFSGADSPKPGLFELANHGTLFLDEIGELEPRMQVKLLRVLDGVAYYRLGGVRKVTVDVRVVAATNQNLEQMVRTGDFRGDLYHRLGQICLHVPPLRERPDDIVPLAEYFLKQSNPRSFFSGSALAELQRYPWPGNIRELRNAVTKAAVLTRDLEIRGEDLVLGQPGPGSMVGLAQAVSNPANLDGMEKTTILKVLAQTNGHQQKAAELLGISRRTLSRKLKLYGREAVRQTCAS
jgi:two-component system, NtrC family, response regulator AtoC